MKTDIQIAQEATMLPIKDVAANYGITEDDLELYGKYKAKFSDEFMNSLDEKPDGKLVLMTAINPTPAGEGKTTTSVGVSQALNKLGKKTICALREPSLGPCFGIKGGAAGGGYAQVVPMEDLNLHFTGDFHAITSANNLLAAVMDNHMHQGNTLRIDPKRIVFKRCLDMNDRVLRNIIVGMGKKGDGVMRESGFDITVASEIMAILCLATDIEDLKARLSRMVVAYNSKGEAVTAGDLADPHGTHRTCMEAVLGALEVVKDDEWLKECHLWLYRGAWMEWDLGMVDMAVPLSPDELIMKRHAIYRHLSQKDIMPFPGSDPREFWQRAEERTQNTAQLYDKLGMAEYQAIEVFVKMF